MPLISKTKFGAAMLAATFLATSASAQSKGRPNIIFILGDDISARALSCYQGNPSLGSDSQSRLFCQVSSKEKAS